MTVIAACLDSPHSKMHSSATGLARLALLVLLCLSIFEPSMARADDPPPAMSWSIQDRSDERSDFILGFPESDVLGRTMFICRKRDAAIDLEVRMEAPLFAAVKRAFKLRTFIDTELVTGRTAVHGRIAAIQSEEMDTAWSIKIELSPVDLDFWREIARRKSLVLIVGKYRETLVHPHEGLEKIVAFAEGCTRREGAK
jgi:hypothetical protein